MAEEQVIDKELAPVHVLAEAFRQDASEDQRLAATNLMNEKAKQDKLGDKTTSTQWAPLVFSILGRNYEGALDALNGGRVTYADAFGPDGARYKQERNNRGSTGKLYDAEGNLLDENQLKEVNKKGWVVSKEDMTAAGLGEFRAINEGTLAIRKAPYDQVVGAYKKASAQAIESSGIANQFDELQKIAERSRNTKDKVSWLDIYNKLPAEQRAKLSAAANIQLQSATGASNAAGTTAGLNDLTQAGLTENKSTDLSGTAAKGAPPPAGKSGGAVIPSVTGNISEGKGSSSLNTKGSTTGASTEAGTSASSGAQQQGNFRTQVESIFQGKMSDENFTDFQRFIQLNDSLAAAQANRKVSAPGAEDLGKVDPLLSGQKNVGITAYKGMQNEALLSEWNHFLADKLNSSRGRMPSEQQLADDFKDSEVYKAIKYRYGNNIERVKGIDHVPKEGDVTVDNRNKLLVYRNGEWEKKK